MTAPFQAAALHTAKVTPWALALLSAGVMSAELALMQLLSCVQWHHFAYLVVSVALLGFGASGTVLSLARERIRGAAGTLVPWLMAGCGAGFALLLPLMQTSLLRFDLYLLFADNRQWLRLVGACLVMAVPFFCAGLATGILLTVRVRQAGLVYAANLAGAGAGSLGGLLLLEFVEPQRLPALIAIAPLLAALSLFLAQRDRSGVVACAVVMIITGNSVRHAALPPFSPFKDLARTLDLPESRIEYSRPSVQGWLQIVDAPSLRSAPPADLAFPGIMPRQRAVFVDGNRYGSLLADDTPDALAVMSAGAEVIPWLLGVPEKVLLLHDGAEGIAAFAVQQGAMQVHLVEPHRKLAAHLEAQLAPHDSLQVVCDEPRRVLARSGSRFDLIRFPTAGSFGGTAGLRAIGEQFLLTREAVAAAWRALTDDGVLLVTAWMDYPERTPLRLLATLRAGLETAGVTEIEEHVAAVRGWASVTYVVSRPPLSDGGAETIRAFCRERGFDPLLLPGLLHEERQQHHRWDNTVFFRLVDAVASGREPDVQDHYALRLDAPDDDRPYFSQFLRPVSALALARTHGLRGMPFFELGSIIVGVTLVVLAGLACVFIVLPLAGLGPARGHRAWTFLYFAALGAGFMAVEIVLMPRLTPFLGGPVAAAAVVLGSILLAAGLGSFLSRSWAATRKNLLWITTVSAAGIVALGCITRALPVAWDAPWAVRTALVVLLLVPVALVMGTAFPTGLRFLAARAHPGVPWAWAVNGCASVVTPSIAMLLAVSHGFAVVFWSAAAMYTVAALATSLMARPKT